MEKPAGRKKLLEDYASDRCPLHQPPFGIPVRPDACFLILSGGLAFVILLPRFLHKASYGTDSVI